MKNNKKQIIEYGWLQLQKDCKKLAEEIKHSNIEINSIYGIPRGGLVPAVILSHLLDIKMTYRKYQITEKTLIVDDINDSGKTLNKYSIGYTATLWISTKTKHIPNFWIHTIKEDIWIVYPWETLKSTGI